MQFFLSPSEAWEKMFEDCLHAEHTIDIEQYIIENDEVGRHFINLLADKAQHGVQVRIVVDAVGSRALNASPLLEHFIQAGGALIFYHPLWWIHVLLPWLWFPRNHCKMLMVDGKVVHVGGICVASVMRSWRDTQLRLTGPIAQNLQQDFTCLWTRLKKENSDTCPISRKYDSMEATVQQPFVGRYPIYREVLAAVRTSQDYIYLVSPYFFPPRKLRRALYEARARGVDVVLMLSQRTDVGLADKVSRALLGRWKRAGFNVLFYRPSVLHAKYMVIDDHWATMGSTNFDHLSLLYNREANIIFHDPIHVATLKKHFISDCKDCKVASLDDWKRQPWWHKLVGMCGELVHKVM